MKISKAIKAAMTEFEKKGKGEIRTVALQEGSGSGNKWSQLRIRVEYAINGDYTESDSKPFIVTVYDNDGMITTEINGRD